MAVPRSRPSDALPEDIGQKLRDMREERGLSLRELSRRVGVSPSAMSQIETGRTRPSVMTLYMMVSELGMSLDDLLRVPEPPPVGQVVAAPPVEPLDLEVVLRPDGRRTIDLGTGVRWQRLTPLAEQGADFLLVTYEVASSWKPIAVSHAGREYGLVLSGQIRIALAFEEYELQAQDSIAFDSSTPHRIDNIGDVPATAVWCMVGPVGTRRSA